MKRTLIIIGIVLLILVLGLGWVWLTSGQPDTATTDTSAQVPTKTFAPFGFITDMFAGTDTPVGHVADNNGTTTSGGEESRSVYDILNLSPVLKVTDTPVAGATFTSLQNGTTTEERLRYVERETGHIYDFVLNTNTKARVSNTTIPRIQEALWGARGTLVVLRYLGDDKETIETYAATLATTSENTTTLSGTFLPQNIRAIATSPFSPKIFYILATNPGAAGRLYDATTGETKPIFSSSISEWLASWSTPTSVVLSTKPSYASLGFAYTLNTGTGATTRLLGDTLGLTVLPAVNGDILVGSLQNGGLAISRYDTAKKTLSLLAGSTLPEKCAWVDTTSVICALPEKTTGGLLPDSWYDGSVSFSDSIWEIDTEKNLTDFLFDASTMGESVDIINPRVNADGTLLAFINKKDNSLWIASLVPQTSNGPIESGRGENI